ncbi:MAG TPA: ATP-binding protein [Burkholderiaceae bacterium]
MLAITLATFAIYFTLSRLFGDPIEDIALRQAAAPILLLEQYIDRAPADEWLARLNKTREVSNIAFELIPLQAALASLPESKRAALERGDIAVDVAGKALLRRVDLSGQRYIGSDQEVIHIKGLPIEVGKALKMEAVRYIIVALCLLVPAGLWSHAHWRSLQQLSDAANAIGAGQLTTRTALKPSDSVYPLGERMNQMAGRLQSLVEAQKSLIHSVSHELRTPIARMRFSLELMQDAPDEARRATRIAAMEDDLKELETLVDELLQAARPDEAQRLHNSAFALETMLRDTLAGLAHGMQDKSVTLHIDPDLGNYDGDAKLIARALSNLVRNAQKYAQHSIAVAAKRRLSGVTITVDDDGPGIPENERQRIFDAFYRLDRSRDRSTGGYGLGLAIAHKAVTAHGGTLIVGTSPLGGARFEIALPAQS